MAVIPATPSVNQDESSREHLTGAAKAEAQRALDRIAAELLEQGFRRQPDGTLRVA